MFWGWTVSSFMENCIFYILQWFLFSFQFPQIRDIVATATRNQNEYRKVMDHTQAYLHRLNLPTSLQERVRLWFAYTWQSQKTLSMSTYSHTYATYTCTRTIDLFKQNLAKFLQRLLHSQMLKTKIHYLKMHQRLTHVFEIANALKYHCTAAKISLTRV